jgi:hypothetical protein
MRTGFAAAGDQPRCGGTSGYMVVAGQRLPVHTTTEPRADVVFVAPAGTALAQHYRDQMLRFEPCACGTVEYGAVDSSTTKGFSLRLIHVNRDAAGKLYLYRACGHSSSRAVIGDSALLLLGPGEDWRLPIVAMTRNEQGVTLQLDVSKVPEVFRPGPALRYKASSRPGLYEDGDERPALMMTPEEAAKLDVVVRLCRKAKMDEFEFDDPHSL